MKIKRILIIVGLLFLIYFGTWFNMAAIGLSNDRTESLLAFGSLVYGFARYVLSFP